MALYTCGRIHKSRAKPASVTTKARAVIDAVSKLMADELSTAACGRWRARLNTELGQDAFLARTDGSDAESTPSVPRAWAPAKPKLTLALLDQIKTEVDGAVATQACVGTKGSIHKIVARLAVDRMRAAKGSDWFASCEELTDAQRDDNAKLTQVLSRVAFDLLVYVHARASELLRESGEDALIELHSSEQSTGGKAMRGCGIVFCAAGHAIVTRALGLVSYGVNH